MGCMLRPSVPLSAASAARRRFGSRARLAVKLAKPAEAHAPLEARAAPALEHHARRRPLERGTGIGARARQGHAGVHDPPRARTLSGRVVAIEASEGVQRAVAAEERGIVAHVLLVKEDDAG
eukprot:5505647-Prymnesium_polylepis.1